MVNTISVKSQKFVGEIKLKNEHFVVEEIPLYLPSGQGQHLYLNITKNGINTQDLIIQLSKLFSVSKKKIGSAGLKDRNAITTQWISLDLGKNFDLSNIEKKVEESIPNTKINQLSFHTNKLRTGHLVGNSFKILIETSDQDALIKADGIKTIINKYGMPNFFGHQRFGSKGDNAIKGKEILTQQISCGHHKRKFLLSAYQSQLFNSWLSQRISDNNFDKILPGDVVINLDNGRTLKELCPSEQNVTSSISYAGPIFGKRMVESDLYSKSLEQLILANDEVDFQIFSTPELPGSRRAGVVFPRELQIEQSANGIWLSFELPKGSYATVLIDQFVRKG